MSEEGMPRNPMRFLGLAERDAGCVLLDVYGPDAPRTFVLGHAAIDDIPVGVAATRTPAFGAVEHDLAALDLGARRQVRQRRAGLRLGHRDRHLDVAAAHGRYHTLLQCRGGETLDGAHGPDAGFEDREGDRGRHLAEFLQHQQRLDVAEAETAERLGHVDPEEAEFGEIPHQRLVGRVIRFFAFAGHRGQPFLREASGSFLQGSLFVGELEIHGRTWTSIWSPATRTG